MAPVNPRRNLSKAIYSWKTFCKSLIFIYCIYKITLRASEAAKQSIVLGLSVRVSNVCVCVCMCVSAQNLKTTDQKLL